MKSIRTCSSTVSIEVLFFSILTYCMLSYTIMTGSKILVDSFVGNKITILGNLKITSVTKVIDLFYCIYKLIFY